MDEDAVWNAMSKFYGSAYDSAVRLAQEYIRTRDQHLGESGTPEPGSIEELRAVIQLVLISLAGDLESNEDERFLAIDDEGQWERPLVRYIVEYKDEVCQNPDYTLDPIQGWLGDFDSKSMLGRSAVEKLPDYSILDWTIAHRTE